MSERQQAAKVLRKAVELLEADGWCQGKAKDDQGRRCALAALEEADGLVGQSSAMYHLVKAAEGKFSLVQWNDELERTVEDVIAFFERTAERLEG